MSATDERIAALDVKVQWHPDTSADSVVISSPMKCPVRPVGHYFRKVGGGQVRCEYCGAVRKRKGYMVAA